MTNNYKKSYIKNETYEHIKEIIENNEEFTFEYKGKDYYLENFDKLGWIIVEAKSYIESGCFPENPPIPYPMSCFAKTPEELINLPFLDGKTIFEAFDELKFFD